MPFVFALAAQTLPVPADLRRAIDAAYPGWRLAAASGIADARQWVRGDFDGDRRPDYAVQIVRAVVGGKAAEPAQIVVVALGRPSALSGFELVELQAGPVSDIVYLALARRGDRVPDLDADPNGTSSYLLVRDGIHILYAERAGTTCVWVAGSRPSRFECRLSGD